MRLARTNDVTLTRYRLYGERCSGTNFLRALIARNLPDLTFSNSYNWEKHDFVNPAFCHDDELGLVIVRGALDWIRSIHRNPHQAGDWFKPAGFSDFIRHEWSSVFNTELISGQVMEDVTGRELMLDRHPMTGARIANVVELRNLKIRSQLKVRHLYRNWMILCYEEVRDDPATFVAALSRLTRQKPVEQLVPVNEDMAQSAWADRRNQPYAEITPDDLRFIAATLDLSQEHWLGFDYPELSQRQPGA